VSFSLDPLIIRLAEFFKQHDKRSHVQQLRRYWQSRLARKRIEPPLWTEDFVIEWLATIRIPPFDRIYPVRERNAACPKCGAGLSGPNGAGSGAKVMGIFPGGHKAQCSTCGQEWLVLDG
jgi:hypothetical protein